MVSKNNKKLIQDKNRRNVHQRFALRKFNVGVASVLVGVAFSLYGGGQLVAHADTTTPAQNGGVQTGSETGSQKLTSQTQVALTASSSSAASDASAAKTTQAPSTQTIKQNNNTTQSASGDAKNSSVQSTNSAAQSASSDTKTSSAQTNKATKTTTSENQSQSVKGAAQLQKDTSVRNSSTVLGSVNKGTDSQTNATNTLKLLNVKSDNVVPADVLAQSLVQEPTPSDKLLTAETVYVNSATDLDNVIQHGVATTINIIGNINYKDVYNGEYQNETLRDKNLRDITIQSDQTDLSKAPIIDFNGRVYTAPNHSYTFKNLNMFCRNYWGPICYASNYTFDNINFTGAQLVNTNASTNVTFKNHISAKTVASYSGPLDGQNYSTQKNASAGDQQILQFTRGTNNVTFASGSNVNFETYNGDAIQMKAGTITLENGSVVNIAPHTVGNQESYDGMYNGGTARGIFTNGAATVTVDSGATLNINLTKAENDSKMSGAILLKSDGNKHSSIVDNGTINITSTGTLNSSAEPVHIDGDSSIIVNDGAKFIVKASQLGSYNGSLIDIAGSGTIKSTHATFKVTGDGTGAVTGVALASGGTFGADQPTDFSIDLSSNTSTSKALINNGTIDFTRVKTPVDSKGTPSDPLKEVKITYKNGAPTVDTIIGQSAESLNSVAGALTNSDNYRNKVSFTPAGAVVTLKNVALDSKGQLTGNATSTDGNNDIYIKVDIKKSDGTTVTVPGTASGRQDYVKNGNADPTPVDGTAYQTKVDKDGNFTVDLSSIMKSLPGDATITVTADKNYVDDTYTTTVSAAENDENLAKAKENLAAAIKAAEQAKNSGKYVNESDAGKKSTFDTDLSNAQGIASDASLDDIKKATDALTGATSALNGEETKVDGLQTSVTNTEKNADAVADAKKDKPSTDLGKALKKAQNVLAQQAAYEKALSDAKGDASQVDTSKTPYVSQSDVDNAKNTLDSEIKKAQDATDLATAKENLAAAIKKAEQAKNSGKYVNESDAGKKSTFDTDLSNAQGIVSDASLDDIKKATDALTGATSALNGGETKVDDLQTSVTNAEKNADAVADAKKGKPSTDLGKALKKAQNVLAQQAAYEKALSDAKGDASQVDTSKTPYVSQSDVDNAKNTLDSEIKKAQDATDLATAKENLAAAIKKAEQAKNSGKYVNESDAGKKSTFDTDLSNAQGIASDASLDDIKKATDALTGATSALNGEETKVDGLQTSVTNAEKNADAVADAKKDKPSTDLGKALKKAQDVLAQQAAYEKALSDAKGDASQVDTSKTPYVSQSDVDNAKSTLDSEIKKAQDATDLATAKSKASQAIDNALKNKEAEINNSTLPQSQKDDLNQKAQAAADQAKKNIDNATNGDAIRNAETKGIDAINDVHVPSLADQQKQADAAIDDALTKKQAEINNAGHLTDAEKADLNQQASDAANTAKKNIANAATTDAINKAEKDGLNNINDIHVPTLAEQQAAAKDAIAAAQKVKDAEIDAAKNLSDADKTSLKQQVANAAKAANEAIDAAGDDAAIKTAEDQGIADINGIHVPSASEALDQQKTKANQAIDDALKNKQDEINKSNLPQSQKDDLNKQAADAAKTAKDNIKKATDASEVTKAQQDGVNAIDGVKVPTKPVNPGKTLDQQKTKANQAIDDALKNKQDEINKSNLPQSQKDDLNKQAADAAKTAKDNIKKATDASEVTKAQQDGVNAIDGVKVPTTPVNPGKTLDQQKSAANQAIDDALKNKQDEINKSNLPQSQKDDLNKQAADAAKTAKDNIKKATNAGEVTRAQNDGVAAIDDIDVPTTPVTPVNPGEDLVQHKADADKTIDKALADKQNEINNSNLSDDQKAALNQQAADAAKTAKDNIARATTSDDVSNAVFNGVQAINNVKVPSSSQAIDQQKSDANKQIDDALSQKTAEINADNSLTDDQKAQLINKANDLANQAKEAIQNASDASAITDALNQGLNSIKNLSSADVATNDNQNNNGGSDNSSNDNSANSGANNGAAGELNGNAGAASANGAAGASANNGASLNNASLSAMANAVKSANANASANNTNSKKLPQTGANKDEALGLMGLAAAGLVGLMGMAKSNKKEN